MVRDNQWNYGKIAESDLLYSDHHVEWNKPMMSMDKIMDSAKEYYDTINCEKHYGGNY